MKMIKLLALPVLCLGLVLPAEAASVSCEAAIEVHAPRKGEFWLPGKLKHLNGHYTLSYALVSEEAKEAPEMTTIEVDVVKKLVSVSGGAESEVKTPSFIELATAKFSAVAGTPEALGGFVLIGERLKSEAKFIRNTRYGKEPVQEYTFRESDTVFGQVLYSPVYGLPLRLEVFDAETSTRRIVELKGIKR